LFGSFELQELNWAAYVWSCPQLIKAHKNHMIFSLLILELFHIYVWSIWSSGTNKMLQIQPGV